MKKGILGILGIFGLLILTVILAPSVSNVAAENVDIGLGITDIKVNGSSSSIDEYGDFHLKARVKGTNINTITKGEFIVNDQVFKVDPIYNEDNVVFKKKITQSKMLDALDGRPADVKFAYSIDGSTFSSPVIIKGDFSDEVTYGGYTSRLDINSSGTQADVEEKLGFLAKPTVDGSGSHVDPATGNFVIDFELTLPDGGADKFDGTTSVTLQLTDGTEYEIPSSDFIDNESYLITGTYTIPRSAVESSGDQSVKIKYNKSSSSASAYVDLTANTAIDSSETVDSLISTMTGNSSTAITMNVAPAPVSTFEVKTVDGSYSTVTSSGDFKVHFTLTGEALDEITNVRLKLSPSNVKKTTGSFTVSSDKKTLEGDLTFTRDEIITAGADQTINLLYQHGTDSFEGTGGLKAKDGLTAPTTVTTTGYTSTMTGDLSSPIKLHVEEADVPAEVVVNSVDGSYSTVESSGDFKVHFTLKGTNLDKISHIRLKLMPSEDKKDTATFTVNPDGQKLEGDLTISRDTVIAAGADQTINLLYQVGTDKFHGTGGLKVKNGLTSPTTVTTTGYTSTMTGDASSPIKLHVEEADVPETLQIDTIDGSGSHVVSSNGNLEIDFTITGTNLDLIEKVKIKLLPAAISLGTSDLDLNASNTVLTGKVVFNRDDVYATGEEQSVKIFIKEAGQDLKGYGYLMAETGANSEETVGGYTSTMTGNSTTGIKVKVEKANVVNVVDIDGSGSSVASTTGDYTINFRITGTGLSEINSVKINLNPAATEIIVPASDLFISDTSISGSVVFDRDIVKAYGTGQVVQLSYKTASTTYTTPVGLTADTPVNSSATVSGYISSMTGNGTAPLTLFIEAVEEPEVEVTMIDGSGSHVDSATGNFVIDYTISGTNIDKISSIKLILTSGSPITLTNFSTYGTTLLQGEYIVDKSLITEGSPQTVKLSYATDGVYSVPENLCADISINDTKTVDGITSTMTATSTQPITLSIGEAGIHVTSVDGSYSVINSTSGNFQVVAETTGEALDQVDAMRFYYLNDSGDEVSFQTVYNEEFSSQSSTRIISSINVGKNYVLMAEGISIEVAYSTDEGLSYTDRQPLYAKTEIDDEVAADGFVSTMVANVITPVTLDVKIQEDVTPVMTGIDGKDSILTSNGYGNYIVDIYGENLDQVDSLLFQTFDANTGGSIQYITIDKFERKEDSHLRFSLQQNNALLPEQMYENKTAFAQVTLGDQTATVTSSLQFEHTYDDSSNKLSSTIEAGLLEPVTYSVSPLEVSVTTVDGLNSHIDSRNGLPVFVVDVYGEHLNLLNSVPYNIYAKGYENSTGIKWGTVTSFTEHTEDHVQFSIPFNSYDLERGKGYIAEAYLSFDNGKTYDVLRSTRALSDTSQLNNINIELSANPYDVVYFAMSPNPVISSLDAKKSNLITSNGAADYIVEITGKALKSADTQFRTVDSATGAPLETIDITSYVSQSDTYLEFSLASIAKQLNPTTYMNRTAYGQVSVNGGKTWVNATSTLAINQKVTLSNYVSNLNATPGGLVYYNVTSDTISSMVNIDGKNSRLTGNAEGNYVVEITGTSLQSINQISFRTVSESSKVLDTFTISNFDIHNNTSITFNLNSNGHLLNPADYVGQKVHAEISSNGSTYFNVNSSQPINLSQTTADYTAKLTAQVNGPVYYEVDSLYADIFEMEDTGNIISYDVTDHSRTAVYALGSQERGVEGLAWDEEDQKLFYAANMETDAMFGNDKQDIYVLSNPVYENGVINFTNKFTLYKNLTVYDAFNHDVNALNEGATYNKNSDTYEFTYRKSDGMFGGKPHDIKLSYAASGAGGNGPSVNFTQTVPGYDGNRAYDIAYDHIHDTYIVALGGSGVISSNNGTKIYTGKANGLAVRGDYLYIVESAGDYAVYDLKTYQPVLTLETNLPTLKDAA